MCTRLTESFRHIVSDQQHGFLKGRSTTSNLVEFVSNVTKQLEGRMQVDALYLDYSKAFDSLDHRILVGKLAKYGLSNKTVDWFSAYLNGRQLRVRAGDAMSDPFIATSGVPQGSHLGPILFLIFIQDLVAKLEDVGASMFADDLKIYHPISSINDCLHLQRSLDRVNEWSHNNHLLLNAQKCQTMVFNRRRSRIEYAYTLDDTHLARVSVIKDLGLFLDGKLTFKTHIDRTVARCKSILGQISRFARGFMNTDVIKTLYCSLVRSIIEYAAPAWSSHHVSYMNRLESIQKRFLLIALGRHRIPGTYALHPYAVRLGRLKLDKIVDRHKLACVTLVYDSLMGRIDCQKLRNKIKINTNRRGRRSRYLYVDSHPTLYGKNEPVNMCVGLFNDVADIFLTGVSRAGFRKLVVERYRS